MPVDLDGNVSERWHRLSRLWWRYLKWKCLVVCVVIGVAWAANVAMIYHAPRASFGVTNGSMLVAWPPYTESTWRRPTFTWLPVWKSFGTGDGKRTIVMIPLWILLVWNAIPTASLWWRDRGPPNEHGQDCGYSLAGNESGVCPECGKAISDAR